MITIVAGSAPWEVLLPYGVYSGAIVDKGARFASGACKHQFALRASRGFP